MSNISCDVYFPGFPEPAVMWYHGTMKLVPTNNIVTVTTGRRNKLTFLRLMTINNVKIESQSQLQLFQV